MKLWVSILISLFVFILGYLFFLSLQTSHYANYDDVQSNSYTPQDNVQQNADGSDEFSSATRLHWTHMPLTVNFSNECTRIILIRNRNAFNEIANETDGLVTFEEVNDTSADISFICKKEIPTTNNDMYMTNGDAQYFNEGNEITSAIINYYGVFEGWTPGGCSNFPDVEIHELLHTFGFGHVSGNISIMNAIQDSCPTRIDKDIVEELKSTYSK